MANPSKDGACQICGRVRPRGRTRYCSDECLGVATVRRTRAKDDKRLASCWRCQGPKEPGIRGGKYCEECRRVISDQYETHERERGRRRHLKSVEARLAAGKPIQRRTANIPEGFKWCNRCQEARPHSSFSAHKSKAFASYCKPCQRVYNMERRLKLNFAMSWDDYDMLLAIQDGRCAICNGRPRKYALSVDHDHKTGEIRGLLCSRCNHKLLGSANDDPARLRKAADYLETYLPRDVFGQRRFIPGFGHDEREPLDEGDSA